MPKTLSINSKLTTADIERLCVFGERFDRLMTLEVRPLTGGLPAGIVVPTYLACRAVQGEPSSTLAARKLLAAIRPGSDVIVATGAGVAPKLPLGETDGPPGAVALARSLALGFGANVTLVAQDEHMPAVDACVRVIEDVAQSQGSITTAIFPKGEAEGLAAATDIFDRLKPTAVIFVERDGPNEAGHYHGIRGDRRPPGTVADVYRLAYEARQRNVLTVGIGDGGNEIGFGKIREAVAALLPCGGRSQPDETGVVTITETDVLVSASVSNWGAYAVSGALAIALDDENLAHSGDREHAFIVACIAAGALDGATSRPALAVDGIDWRGHSGVAELMRSIAISATSKFELKNAVTASSEADLPIFSVLNDAQAKGGYHL
ncbi:MULTISPECIES: glutamate cyclase domain-containing protein [Agrobacterium]|uniref:D-glutamate cyclase-like C-terminal domain-containing protein n=1 Tax=Agrobacterium tumefaciens TaxID=358 RepID=A0AAW8M2N1_AGRTU|nr:glutamate cyclase domain-containing protein [Agrobacterium tumefaciens]MBP2511528.1 hypothetical protein [Agrobacterium tumefaciens]MBP2520757.1 hypothetical protein [Agrobacterium tumefaciens]MBP2537534.1 hypothetical protein [Agrobacterium tumefaciens]MBP2542676.1 hypothetical protein [Agrobacterium tumefaciens]MBP2568691.1 hypothetical protein [Agrobacterium tumefaciens]